MSHLSHLALQVLNGVQLPLPAVLRGHLVLAAAPDVPAQLGLGRQTSRLGVSKQLGPSVRPHTCSAVRPGLANISLKVSTGQLITSKTLQVDCLNFFTTVMTRNTPEGEVHLLGPLFVPASGRSTCLVLGHGAVPELWIQYLSVAIESCFVMSSLYAHL